MKAFLDDPKIKEKYLARVRAHAAADEIVKGKYWVDGKGCAVGCTIHGSNHAVYELELGIPAWLARLEDTIFEGLPNDKAMKWPGEFLAVIPVGANLEKIKAPFLVFALESTLDKFDHLKWPMVKESVDAVIALYKSGETDIRKFRSARAAAQAAADVAYAAAYAAATTAIAAADAADAADAVYAADVACAAARSGAYVKLADKLLELLGGCE